MLLNNSKVLSQFLVNIQKLCIANTIRGSLSSRNKANMNANDCNKICWMDLEMTGLDVRKDKIMEISCIITDKDLNILSEGPSFAIHHPKEVLENMGPWCKTHHNESGLTQMCLKSEINMEKAEEILLEYLQKHIPRGKVPLAGNSIYMDRLFLRDQLPRVNEYLFYRVIDVSTVKELACRWNPEIFRLAPKKKLKHRSLDDIKESIAELQYYRQHFFKNC